MKLYFDFAGPNDDRWMWHLLSEHGKVLRQSDRSFPYYLTALADARANGIDLEPSFRPPKRPPGSHS